MLNIDVTNSNFHKEVITVDIGTRAKSYFAKNLIPDEKQVDFKRTVTVSKYFHTIYEGLLPNFTSSIKRI